MPTIHWIGKEKIVNHHLDIPYHTLDLQYTFNAKKVEEINTIESSNPANGANKSDNKIIHADNFLALKALLPEYEGRIKCIYIDPPYNTGNESWVYNDNVSDPRLKKWLGKVVGKEAEDLTRHDKWLCMMYPRLKLLHKLLAEDGLLFINLDDNEVFNCKFCCDEIFGLTNFITNIAWEKRFTRINNAKLFSSIKDNLLLYRKSSLVSLLREERNEKSDSTYSNPDNDPRGVWTSVSYVNPAIKEKRKNLSYQLFNPIKKTTVEHPTHAWKYAKETYLEHVEENRLYWGIDGNNTYPRQKKLLNEMDGMVPVDIWKHQETGTTDEASKMLEQLFGSKNIFDTPKTVKLIERVLRIISYKNAIVLDSFAGSGTTAHAVLNLNKQDGGNRKFIMIEMEDFAENITAERVKRVMNGYGNTEGTGGSFSFYTMGERVLDDEGNLNPQISLEKIHRYIWYSETHQPFVNKASQAGYLGKCNNTGIYFHYLPQ